MCVEMTETGSKRNHGHDWTEGRTRGEAGFRGLNSVMSITSSTGVPHRDPPPPPTLNTRDWLLLLDDDQL